MFIVQVGFSCEICKDFCIQSPCAYYKRISIYDFKFRNLHLARLVVLIITCSIFISDSLTVLNKTKKILLIPTNNEHNKIFI